MQLTQPGPILTRFLLVIPFFPGVLDGGKVMVVLGCGAKPEVTAVRAGSSQGRSSVQPSCTRFSKGNIARIWFKVCRSSFHYTTVLVAAAYARSRPCWMLLIWWAPFPGNYSLQWDVQKQTGFLCCSTNWGGGVGGLEWDLLQSVKCGKHLRSICYKQLLGKKSIFLRLWFFPDKGRTKNTWGMDLIIDHRSSNEDQISCISLNRYECSWHKLHWACGSLPMSEGQDCLCEEGYTPGLVSESATVPFHFTRDKMVRAVSRNHSILIPVPHNGL